MSPSPLPRSSASVAPELAPSGVPASPVPVAAAAASAQPAEESVDLGSLDAAASPGPQGGSTQATVGVDSTFTPYVFDRSPAWVLLPAFALALVGVHLLKLRPAGHRSEVRPEPGAELSPLSQFGSQSKSPPGGSSGGKPPGSPTSIR